MPNPRVGATEPSEPLSRRVVTFGHLNRVPIDTADLPCDLAHQGTYPQLATDRRPAETCHGSAARGGPGRTPLPPESSGKPHPCRSTIRLTSSAPYRAIRAFMPSSASSKLPS